MTKKKWVAVVTAFALLVLPLQMAFAAEGDPINTVEGNQVITGDAAVDYVNPADVISFTVPTSASLGFTLDPQNLAATQGVGAWDPSQGGSIIPAAVNIVLNESAVPLKATAHFTLSDPSETNKLVLVDDPADVNSGTDKNMYLSFVPANAKTTVTKGAIAVAADPVFVQDDESADKVFDGDDLTAAGVKAADMLAIDDAATAKFGQFVSTDVEGANQYWQVQVPAHEAVGATTQTTVSAYTAAEGMEDTASAAELADMTGGTDLAFALKQADYYVLKDSDGYQLVYDDAARNDNYDTASFILSGLINKNADWSGYNATNKITVQATYSFDVMTPGEYDAAMDATIGESYNSLSLVTVSGVSITGGDITVAPGESHTFAAEVTGTNSPAQTVTWSVSGSVSDGTTISTDGELTVAEDETAETLTVTATSTADSSKSDTVTVTVGEPAATVDEVTVSPATASVTKGGTKAFTAEVTGANSPAQTVTWSVSGTTSSIDEDGVLSVAAGETAETLTVTATSTVDESKSGTATVTVTAPAATVDEVTVSPATASVTKGGTKAFTAEVTGANSPAQTVTWSVSGTTSSIDEDGVLSVAAGETAETLTVTATSTVDESKSGTATVTVTAPAVPGFTDEGSVSTTASKVYNYSKATNADLTFGFNFAGNTDVTSFTVSSGTSPTAGTGYVLNVGANTITLKAAYLATLGTVGTKTFSIVMGGVTYALSVKATA